MKWEQGGIQFNAGTKRENLEEFPAQAQNTVHNNQQHIAHVHNTQYTVHCAHVDCNEHCPGAPLVQSFPWLKLCRSYNGPTAMTFWTSMRSIRADLAEDLCWSAGRRLLRRWRRILMHGGEGKRSTTHLCAALLWFRQQRWGAALQEEQSVETTCEVQFAAHCTPAPGSPCSMDWQGGAR